MKKKFRIVALLLALTFALTACGGGKTNDKETGGAGGTTASTEGKFLRTNNTSEPGSLDPALAQGTHESWVLQHTFEGLMTYDEEGNVVPGAAEAEPEISEDGLNYTFKLKEGLKWSNGEPVTAKDFEFSWKRLLDPDLAADYAHQGYYLKNGEAFNKGKVAVDEVGVKAVDDLTLEVTLENPTPFFTELTAFYSLFPVSEKVVTENPDWAKDAKTHVSNGPFKLTTWEHRAEIIIEKNENYQNADAVKIDGIHFDILEDKNTEWQNYDSDQYDIIVTPQADVVAQKQAEGSEELVIGTDVAVYYYNVNNETKPFTNPKVRQALSMALDRKTLVENVSQSGEVPAEGVVPFGMKDENNKEYRDAVGNLITEDVEQAKTLFEEGLKEEGMTLDEFNAAKFNILYNTDDKHQKMAEAVQDMWNKNLGISIGLKNTEFQVKLNDEKAGNYDVSRAGWIGDYADPLTFLELWETEGSFNDANYANEEYDNLVQIAKTSNDAAERFEAMRKAEKIVVEDMAVIPIYFYTQPYMVKPNVKGIYKTLLNYPTMTFAEIE
ncbi:peptide ABC transporter substrate-binding protein [Miniphocaeibacter halophilus]|uniref:Peptide ABC transporter substrate-binding protein n=1 Tax=Miniphocaeibacter halophilus TaxID=2931922 RepID=A0AC61N1T3_9FIRM|nr:peptide ABC transporter substrate-binding protein [Miniphocaeibacter halophilus]QQK09031.1 peptide ABC transporter substrate-binding protein [Miniphocaeibacter halophilus]